MAKIKITTVEEPFSGMHLDFKAPCACTEVEGLLIGSDTYTVVNALGDTVTGIGGAWDVGSVVSVILDCETKKAYIQNPASIHRNEGPLRINGMIILNSDTYGAVLPTPGNAGRLFFKEVE